MSESAEEIVRLASPLLGDAERDAIARVLASGMLVQGREVEAFERAVAERCGRAHGVAVASGTAALEIALRALEIGPSHEVIVSDVTWPSPAHAVVLSGATPVLIDVDENEWNPSAASFAKAKSQSTRAAIVIDQFGAPSRHREIADALGDVPIIEDAACAIGSTIEGRACGAFGVIACLSFHPRKVITTGEGGMCLTDDARLADALRTLRNHGQKSTGVFVHAGPNLRLTEMQGAMGRVQIDRLDAIVATRRKLANLYRTGISSIDARIVTQAIPEGATRNEQTFGLILPRESSQSDVIAKMKARGIECGRLSYALHTLPSLTTARLASESYTVADVIVSQGLALPLHTAMNEGHAERVLRALAESL